MFAVVLTGPPGAGKTTALTALSDALSDDDIPHAAVEVEALVWTHPALGDAQRWRHVHTACVLYREAGHRLLLVSETTETNNDLAALRRAVGADEYLVVRLHAQPATLAERIVEREPPGWSGLAALVEHAQELALSMPALDGVDLVANTDAERADDIAARIRDARPDQLRP